MKAMVSAPTRFAELSMVNVIVDTPPCTTVVGANALLKPIASAGMTVRVADAAGELFVKFDVSVDVVFSRLPSNSPSTSTEIVQV